MKKILTLIMMVVAFAAPSQAQVKFGLQGGLNLTSMSLNRSEFESAVKNNAGFFIGPTVKFTVPIVGLSFDAAALFDQRSVDVEAANEKTTVKQQTLQVPINIRYGVGLSSIANVFAFAGPQFGFNLGSKNKTLADYQGEVAKWTMNNSNLSLNLGVGAVILNHVQLKVNYNIALGKTGEFKEEGTLSQVADVVKARSNAWQISAAYYF